MESHVRWAESSNCYAGLEKRISEHSKEVATSLNGDSEDAAERGFVHDEVSM